VSDDRLVLKERLAEALDRNRDRLVALGQDVFGHAEPGFREERTATRVADHLRRLQLEPEEGLALTGVKEALARAEVSPDQIAGVMLGTTHFTNAVIEGRHLAPTAAVRLGLPATASVPRTTCSSALCRARRWAKSSSVSCGATPPAGVSGPDPLNGQVRPGRACC
jgi:hypothetical protein